MSHLLALPGGTLLANEFRIDRVLGAGGFGITYLATEEPLGRLVTIKEYFPADFALRVDQKAVPKSEGAGEDYRWGLARFIAEAQTLARFDHPNIVKVYRYFEAHDTAYMVLHFEEGQSFKGWLKSLGRAPRQAELDQILGPLLGALEVIHEADFLHRDIAPDNIIIRKDGSPVLIDFGSARGEIAKHSRTLSALVKPGYSPYEQYAETGHRQGPWTDIYALAATLYHAVGGKRPADAPSRVVKDQLAPAREVALSSYRAGFLSAIDRGLALDIDARPPSIKAWRGDLLAPDQKPARAGWLKRVVDDAPAPSTKASRTRPLADLLPPAPDAPGEQGGFLDFVDGLKGRKSSAGDADVDAITKPKVAATDAAAVPLAAPVGSLPLPKPEPRAAKLELPATPAARKAARPKPLRKTRRLTPLLLKLAIGGAIASMVVAVQERLTHDQPSQQPATARRPTTETRALAQAPLPQTASPIETRSIPAPPSPPARPPVPAPAAPPAETAVAEPVPTPIRPSPRAAPTAAPSANAASALRIAAHQGEALAVRYGGDGGLLVSAGADRKLRTFASDTGAAGKTISLPADPTALAVQGRLAAVGFSTGDLAVYDVDRGDAVVRLERTGGPIAAVALIGPDRLAAAEAGGAIGLWDIANRSRPTGAVDATGIAVTALAPQPGGGLLAVAGEDGTITLWDSAQGTPVRTLKARSTTKSLTFSPDGRVLVSASSEGVVRIWSATTGRLQRVLRGPKTSVEAIAWSPTGQSIATGWKDGVVRITSTTRWRSIETTPVSSAAVLSLAYSSDGRTVAAAAADGSVTVWPVAGSRRDGE